MGRSSLDAEKAERERRDEALAGEALHSWACRGGSVTPVATESAAVSARAALGLLAAIATQRVLADI